MMYRNKREYGQAMKDLESALQEGARKSKRAPSPDDKPEAAQHSQP